MLYKHYDGDGRARFVTFSLHRPLPVLADDRYCREVAKSVNHVREKYKFQLMGYVFMPEHVHLVLIPRIDTKVGEIIGKIKRQSSIAIHELLNICDPDLLSGLFTCRNGVRRFVLWKRRCYDHNCRTPESMWQKINYCHDNPVRRTLVATPEEWQWSSYRWYQGHQDVPLMMDVDETHPMGNAPGGCGTG